MLDNDSDPDGGDTLTAIKMSGLFTDSGSVDVRSGDGTFSYQYTDPNPTSDSFLYEACDQHGSCTPGLVSISITNGPLDQPPIGMDDAILVAPNGTAKTLVGDLNVPASVLDNDSDPDAGARAQGASDWRSIQRPGDVEPGRNIHLRQFEPHR